MRNNSRPNLHLRHPQAGLSLVELLISVTLGLVVLAGVSQVFVSTSSASRTQAAIVTLQENGRFVLERLKPIGRLAGRMGACVVPPDTDTGNINVHLDVVSDARLLNLYDPTRPVVAWNFTGTGQGDSYTLGALTAGGATAGSWTTFDGTAVPATLANRAVPGSDIVVAKRARAIPDLTACTGNTRAADDLTVCDGDGNSRNSGIPRGNVVLVTDCTGYDVFQNTAGTDGDPDGTTVLERSASAAGLEPGNRAGTWYSSYGNTMQVHEIDQFAYYVGVNAAGEPALFEINFGGGGASQPRELVQGVESLQVLVGEFVPATSQVIYRDPDAVTDPSLVLSLRIAVLLRAEGPDQLEDTANYQLAGTTIDPPDDNRMRQVFEMTVNTRNNGELL